MDCSGGTDEDENTTRCSAVAPTIEVLQDVSAVGGGSRYVFPGRNPDKPISNNTMLFALYRLGYKGKMTGHGFRAVASTMLNEAASVLT